MRLLVMASSAILLAACSSPPKPPTVSGSDRGTINSTETLEMIALRAKLAHSQEQLRLEQTRPVVQQVTAVPSSHVLKVHFPFNDTTLRVSTAQAAYLLQLVSRARRIEVRGRTDGLKPSDYDEQVALSRALAAQRYLVGLGVSPSIIAVNYVSAGDFIGDNHTTVGKSLNRRVEIEIIL